MTKLGSNQSWQVLVDAAKKEAVVKAAAQQEAKKEPKQEAKESK